MTILEQVSNFIITKQFSEHERKMAVHHIIDTFTAIISGSYTDEGEKLLTAFYDKDIDILLGKKGSLDDVFLYSSLARLTEVDDIHIPSCTTPGSVIVPAIFALTQAKKDTSYETIIDATIAGYTMLTRLGKAIDGARILKKGIWPTYFCAAFGSAATASRLLGLSIEDTIHALALSLTMTTGGVSRSSESTFRWLTLGNAARSGVFAAIMASKKYKGDPEMLDHDWIEKTYGIKADTFQFIKDLDQENVFNHMSMKPFCSAKQVIPSLSAFERIIQTGIDPEEIVALKITVPHEFVQMTNHGAFDRVSSLTSIPYQMAVLLYHPELLYDITRSNILQTNVVKEFISKISISGDDTFSSYYPEKWVTRVEVMTKKGVMMEYVENSWGDPEQRFGVGEVLEKSIKLLSWFPRKNVMENIKNEFDKILLNGFKKDSILALTRIIKDRVDSTKT